MSWKSRVRPFIPKPVLQRYIAWRVANNQKTVRQRLFEQYGRYAEYTLTQRSLPELFPEGRQASIEVPVAAIVRDDTMEMPLAELLSLAGVTQISQPKTIFEFGTYMGATTRMMAQHSSPETKIYTLDLDVKTRNEYLRRNGYQFELSFTPGQHFHNTPEASKITQLWLGLEPFDFSPYYGQMDLVLVDADHSYPFVKADTEVALKLVRPGGVVVWDDYTWVDAHPECVGVTRCVNELAERLPIYRIKQTRLAIYRVPA
ncbi:MAG TPA: class I SAM-dependent methyltransferase [Herpetosiphon sp.]|uniref:O-methyltransferase family 3 n=1 Tax=Herpetosiphon aurantiacus (strain ATCC 23779 / DSM 785 / 114-95) TaxID=316274 RepID=A9AZW9_HERA2|nr:class I SAM-dependent methyltransferase [Herpetosiphon sp.]ABX03676.1 O-methyltransferase family 3 [Herpetosiphon aurantiacus DSM 785]HBW51486.1 class I SAM-dependent methyltransferase [Herpetosiphon sp.]